MLQMGKVQYSCPLLCTDPGVALGCWVWVQKCHPWQRRACREEQGTSDACPQLCQCPKRTLATFQGTAV